MISFTSAANTIRAYFNRKSPEPDFAFVAGGLVNANGTVGAKVDASGNLVFTGEAINSVSDALSANSGGVQAGATPLPSSVNRFTTVGGAGYSAVLPAAAAGAQVTVINATSTSMNVYPAGTDAINALSASAAFALAANTTVTFFSTVAAHWNSLAAPAATFSPSVTGTLSLTDATTPAISLASGSTNTGNITINGKTSGSLIIKTADATGQAITISPAAQTSGAATLTTPDFAGVNDTFAFITKAQTFSNKTLASPIFTTKITLPNVNTAVAAAGSTNSDAAALTSASLQHVSSDSAAKGVILPVGVAGMKLMIINDSATACKIYPDAGGNVNGGTTTSGSVTILASKGVIATCTVALTWIVYDLAAKSA